MSELWRTILNKDIQESKITTGDAYRIASTLSQLESQLSIEKQRREAAEALIKECGAVLDNHTFEGEYSNEDVIAMRNKVYGYFDNLKSQSHEK